MHGKELAVLAVVGALVLWGGAAAAVQAPANQATADATDGVTALQEGDADVSFSDQTVEDNEVTVDSVTVPEGGYVTIHDSSLLEGDAVGSVVGTSEYLEPGTHEDVTVTLDEAEDTAMNGTQDLIAMPHMETTDDESYDFVSSEGEDDGPYTTDGEAVVDDAEVTFEMDGADETADNETADNETDTTAEADTEDADANETATEDDAMDETAEMNESELSITDLEAPAYIPSNESFEVSVNVTNTGDEEHSEEIAYRLEGGGVDVVVHENVTLDAGETQNVSLEVDENLSEDDYIHGITTYNSSEFNELTVTDDALVNFEDQEADGNNVTVEYAYVPEGGYVTVHDSSLLDGEVVGSVVGVSEYLEPGWHNDVNVTLYEGVEGAEFDGEELSDNETFVAMPHLETGDDETYDFVATEGEEDGAYVTDGVPVTDAANVSGVEGAEGAPTDEADNETTTEDEQTTEAPTDDETAEDDEADVGPAPISDGEDNETDDETTEAPAAPDNETDDGMADNETDGEPVAPGNDTADNETDGEPAAPGDGNETDNETDDESDNESGGVDPGLIGSPTDDGDAGAGNETDGNETGGDGAGTDDNATDTGTEDNATDTGTDDNATDTGGDDNATDTGGDTTDGNATDGGTTDDTMTTTADGNETATGNETTTEAGA